LHVEEKTDTIMQNYVFFAVKNIKPSLNWMNFLNKNKKPYYDPAYSRYSI
jgi:hypothetical protein